MSVKSKARAFPKSLLMYYKSQSRAIPEWWQAVGITGRRNKHAQWNWGFSCIGWVGAQGKVIFIHYSKYFHNLHGKKTGILFSGYKPVSAQCLFLMSCLFCTCLEMGEGWVPEHFFSFSDAGDWCIKWSWMGIASPRLRAHSVFFLHVQSGWMRKV